MNDRDDQNSDDGFDLENLNSQNLHKDWFID